MTFRYIGLDEEQCRRLEVFAELLIAENRIHNLTAITEPGEIYRRHFADSLEALEVIHFHEKAAWQKAPCGSLADVGSGAGLPGLALAIALPHWTITSIEATGKKVQFQKKVIETLSLANACVVHGRAEELAHDPQYRETFDIVTARAVASLDVLAELGLPLLKPGGRMIAYKGADYQKELESAASALSVLGGQLEKVVPYSLAELTRKVDGLNVNPEYVETDQNRFLIVFHKTGCTEEKYPRPWRRIKKSLLGS
ncbi:MAG: 16S rRNA (guanine(527)-N(7))-methyltransferase RsmG [Sedimentisphaerales bacterium]|nr:16S rRNA (guanine(527)-N(7))-methyltransferase RsmG [Sedimentisphaerales bacterium]